MTDETVDCHNCGRPNPEWAQVCRSCGVPLRHGQARVAPTGRFPTDRDSITSIGAVIGTILLAVVIGVFVSSLNTTDATVGFEPDATPTPSATPEATPSAEPSVEETAAPTPSAAPPLPGTLVFGTQLDANRQVTEPVETFTPGMTFVHSISSTEPFGQNSIGETVLRLNEDGSSGETIVSYKQNQLSVAPDATSTGYVAGDAANFIRDWGPGLYEMRIYVGDTQIAKGRFRLSEG
jgi:hypothetical protein